MAVALDHVRRGYGGAGGVFRGGRGGGLVGHLQRNEYARYARDVARLKGKCLVLTGTAAAFPARVLREVSEARRSGRIPAGDGHGGVHDTTVLTEDNELTFAIKHLGHEVISPAACTLVTGVMPTWRELWRQRLRWKRGAEDEALRALNEIAPRIDEPDRDPGALRFMLHTLVERPSREARGTSETT